MSDISNIQTWLTEVLGEQVDWEVNPATIKVLLALREKNICQEKHLQIILDEVERARYEYDGEVRRLESYLALLGVEDRFLSGPSSVYTQVLTESCSILNEDNIGSGLLAAAARVRIHQSQVAPGLASVKAQVEGVKADTLKLYSQLERLGEAVASAEKTGREDTVLSANQSKKLEFMSAKEKQYKSSLERDETLFHKNTGGDPSLTHSNIEKLAAELAGLEVEIEEARRQISGYLSLPPSCDLAKVEISRAEKELMNLTEQVNSRISTLNF